MADAQAEMSKSAKRRAAKKARDAAAADADEPAPVVEAVPKAKAKVKSQAAAPAAAAAAAAAGSPDPKAKAKAKAKAELKAPESPPAQAEASAKAKAKAKAEPKSQSKNAAKAAPTPAAKKQEDEEPVKEKNEDVRPYDVDDGSGPAWDVCDGLNAKQRRRMTKIAEEKKMADLAKAQGFAAGNKHIPGLGVVDPNQGRVPGMAPSGTAATAAVNQSVNAAPAVAAKEEVPKVQSSTASVKVPEARIGVCIGPKGATLKLIQEKTGTRIDTSGEMFTITGPAEGVQQAEVAINDLASKGYTPMQYEDFNENFVVVPKESFPDLIGKKGCVVQAMKKELGVEVSFPPTDKSSAKKFKVTIAGRTQGVEKAKEVINGILMYGHHEVTHPGETHEEVEVPEWAYSAIIGKKGSELRHMQNCHKVRVAIPRESSVNQNVVIVGEPLGVTRCKAHIEKLVYNFMNQSKGRDRQDQADDGWGDDGEVEDWMKAYMYKR